jgi:hypothetical protein
MRRMVYASSVAFLVLAPLAFSGVDGVVINGTTGKPQAGSTVTLFQTTQQGPQNLGSVKTDAEGKFAFTQAVQPGRGGGPLLLQAVHGGVQYNKTITPGVPTTGVNIPVFESAKAHSEAKIEQHFFVLEPSPNGTMQVNEGFIYKNEGKTTWNDPDRGTLQFELPASAQGKVEVNVLAPGGLPIRRAPDPLGKPNQFKVDFPIKPGESRVDLAWSMPFKAPGVFENHPLSKADLLRIVAPPGVEFKASDISVLGQEPTSKATIYAIKGPDVRIQVEGTGLFNAPEDSAGSNNGQSLSENLPKLYGMLSANSSLLQSVSAVKWILATVFGMLALGFILLYRKGNPNEPALNTTAATAAQEPGSETATKASRHARGRG